jgi:putative ABC transport system permease protein
MTFRDTLDLAVRNLRQSKLRTALTTLGVSIGIASLAGMVSLGVGLQDQFVGRFTKSGMFDAINVLPGSVGPINFGPQVAGRGRGRRAFGRNAQAAQAQAQAEAQGSDAPRELTEDTLKELASLAQVKDVYPTLRVPVEVKFGGDSEFQLAAGMPMSVRGEGAFQSIPHGRFFSSEGEAGCMLSLDFARRIDEGNPGKLVGQVITLNYASASAVPTIPVPGMPPGVQRVDWKCTIVGIVERETGPFAAAGGVTGLMIPMLKAKEIFMSSVATAQMVMRDPSRATRPYPSAVVKVRSAKDTQDVQDQIKKMGFSAFSLNDALQGAKRAFIILDIVLSLIGSIALAVSSLGIMNTMVMSILERTREIGIMKAIGGSDGDIRRIFLIEASAIGFLGGVAGIVLGWSVGRAINFGANIYIERQGGTPGNLFSLPWWLVGGAIGFSIAVSLLAGSYPAARAAKLDPIRALRHD